MNSSPYRDIEFPPAPPGRPYTLIDMVTTVDGRIVSGDRGEDVSDLGSKVDHAVMRALQDQVDGVLIGAGTLRATPTGWNPKTNFRVVVSKSGDVDTSHSFFSDGRAFVGLSDRVGTSREGVEFLSDSGPAGLLERLAAMGCRSLLILGGSVVNGLFLEADLVDEIFVTVAPKIKLGHGLPTIAEGRAFPRHQLPAFNIVEHHRVADELFIRYRRAR